MSETEIGVTYTGEELPEGVKGLIVMRSFGKAVAVLARRIAQDHAEVMGKLASIQNNPEKLAEVLATCEAFEGAMSRVVEQEDDSLYRKPAEELYKMVGMSITEALVNLTAAIWVTDGCDIPDGLIELVKKAES